MRAPAFQTRGFFALAFVMVLAACGDSDSEPAPKVSVLSSDPTRVTGESALISIQSDAAPRVTLNGADISNKFAASAVGGARKAVVDGLRAGENALVASIGGNETSLTLKNTPSSGPLFSGPHQTPFICETTSFVLADGSTLGAATDADCSAPTKVSYLYKDTTGAFKPYPTGGTRPGDIATTTTTEGKVLDFIVRVEAGVINRAIYQIAFLHAPGTPLPTPEARTSGWNGGLILGFGGGCGVAYRQGRTMGAPWAYNDGAATAVDSGYAVAATTLTVLGNNCNDVVSGETSAMLKEHFVKRFGPPRFTIGVGGSGGSMQQHLLAQNYPGVLDGLLPGRSFPDTLTTLQFATDCPLLSNYFATATATWTEAEKTAVSGFALYATCSTAWFNYLPRWVSPAAEGCDSAIPRALLYDAVTNPTGTRCGYFDNLINVWGKKADGKPRRALDNVGVQYGLQAVKVGSITVEQFVEMNERIGGYNDDGIYQPSRMAADTDALQIAYRTGRVNEGVGLDSIPIIDTREYVDTIADVHTFHTTFKLRARLVATNGNADNQIMWVVPTGGSGATTPLRQAQRLALAAMDKWLSNIAADAGSDGARAKVLRNKPAEAVDGCFDSAMQKTNEALSYGGTGTCMTRFPVHGDTRIAAGGPVAGDILKCALRPLDRASYGRAFSDAQWSRMTAIYPNGVCDYTAIGTGQQKITGTWQKY